MMRLLKFFGAFILAAIVFFGFVLGWNWKAFTVFQKNRKALMEGREWVSKTGSLKGFSEYIGENPVNASLASVVINQPDSSLYFEENQSHIMGTTANFFLFVAYAMQFDSGTIDPKESIQWSNVSRYQLPDVEESTHDEAFEIAKDRDWMKNGSITLLNAMHLLAEYNDLALADYLWWRLEPEIWAELKDTLNLSATEMPLPYSGLYQVISPGLRNMDNKEIISRWKDEDSDSWRNHVIELSQKYVNDEEFRNNVRNYMQDDRLGNTFMEERDAMILFPKTTAEEMTKLLEKAATDSLINERISRTVKEIMRWPIENQPPIQKDFSDYGALYDSRMGMMNGIDFGTSAYTGDTTVQVLLLDQLPIAFWFHASGGYMHQDFMQRLIFDPAMIDQMYRVVDK